MKSEWNQSDVYEIRQQRSLPDIHSEGILLRHKKSGARVVVVSNDDPNKVFFIGFRTTPSDSTGVAHIIEHTVLCGSEKYPVKDPFIELLKGSMNTFLNAMTYPDKTVYPIASCNDKDFQNLMDVYMDAVLHPNIYKEQNIFRQEGWHYELNAPEDDLTINGVVYNEMKGALSSADSMMEREILNSLYPDTTYGNESGGDPDVIPELTYEQYLDFHRTYYHPSNSYIYLYGDMDVEEKLRWLDEEYLSRYEESPVDSAIRAQEPFAEPASVEKYYNISGSESEENNTYLACSWSVGTNLDRMQYIAFDILDYALLSSQGAPVKQALLDAGIGDDIYGGYDSGIYQPYFAVVAKNTNASEQERFRRIIRQVLEEQVKNGLNQKTLLAAINGAEFKFREADFGRFPKGLVFGLQMCDSWLYDEEQPFLHIEEISVYEELRKRLDTGYFEGLIRKYLLDNPHMSYVCLRPKAGLNAEKEQKLQEKLNAYRDSLSAGEREQLIAQTQALAKYQETPSPKEDLEKIPLLSRADMKRVSDPYSNEEETAEGVTFIRHDYETNGIVYLDYLFDIHHIPEEKIPYLAVLKSLLGRLDTKEYGFLDLANEVNLYTGGIYAEVNTFARVDQPGEYEAKFEIRMRTLEANLEKTIQLAKSIMLHTLFSDEKRICELLAQNKSRLQAELSEAGHSVAATRALAYTSGKAHCSDLLSGIGQFRLLEKIVGNYEEEKGNLQNILQELIGEIMQKPNLTVSATCSRESFVRIRELTARLFSELLPETEKKRVSIGPLPMANEGFMDASRIQYVALAGSYRQAGLPYRGALRVFKTVMSYEYLWQNIRVRGGAYGCGCNAARTGEIVFSSYRDPNLKKTLEVYRGVVEYLKNFQVDERDMTKFVIGTFSEMDAPLTPVAMGRRSLTSCLTGLAWEQLQQERDQVLAADQQSIRDLAALLEAVMDSAQICAIGNEEKLKQEKELFDHLEYLVG